MFIKELSLLFQVGDGSGGGGTQASPPDSAPAESGAPLEAPDAAVSRPDGGEFEDDVDDGFDPAEQPATQDALRRLARANQRNKKAAIEHQQTKRLLREAGVTSVSEAVAAYRQLQQMTAAMNENPRLRRALYGGEDEDDRPSVREPMYDESILPFEPAG